MNRTVPFIPDSVRNRGEIPPEHAPILAMAEMHIRTAQLCGNLLAGRDPFEGFPK